MQEWECGCKDLALEALPMCISKPPVYELPTQGSREVEPPAHCRNRSTGHCSSLAADRNLNKAGHGARFM